MGAGAAYLPPTVPAHGTLDAKAGRYCHIGSLTGHYLWSARTSSQNAEAAGFLRNERPAIGLAEVVQSQHALNVQAILVVLASATDGSDFVLYVLYAQLGTVPGSTEYRTL